eukprot:4279839-Amphidinium_carterae.3
MDCPTNRDMPVLKILCCIVNPSLVASFFSIDPPSTTDTQSKLGSHTSVMALVVDNYSLPSSFQAEPCRTRSTKPCLFCVPGLTAPSTRYRDSSCYQTCSRKSAAQIALRDTDHELAR